MKNPLLRGLVYLINAQPDDYKDGADEITLSVGGVLISGNIMPRKYFYEIQDNAALNMSLNAQSRQNHQDPAENVKIHLVNAFYVVGGQRIPKKGGRYITINMDSVDAYNLAGVDI